MTGLDRIECVWDFDIETTFLFAKTLIGIDYEISVITVGVLMLAFASVGVAAAINLTIISGGVLGLSPGREGDG